MQQPRGAGECAAPLWLPAVSHLPPPAVSSVDVAAVVAAPAVADITTEFCSSPSASVRRSSRTDDGVGTAAQFASRLQELLQPNLAQAALAGDQLVGKFDSAQQASSLDVRVSPPESLVMQPFRRRRLAVGGLPAQQQCSLPLGGARPHFPLSPAEVKALDRQIFQLSKKSLRPASAKTICGRAAPQLYCPWCAGQYAGNVYHADTIVVGMAFHYDGDASTK